MIRLLLAYVLPLVLPTIVYFLWRAYMRARNPVGAAAGTESYPNWWSAPWPWLAVSGVVTLAIALGALALVGGTRPGADYQPPRLEGGEVRGGEFQRPPGESGKDAPTPSAPQQ